MHGIGTIGPRGGVAESGWGWEDFHMMGLPAALLLLAPSPAPAPADYTAGIPAIFATIGHSEWCPAGNVQVDLRTGDYTLTPRAARAVCRDPKLVRPIEHGQVDAARLSAIREAYGRAQEEGLDACRAGKRGDIIVSNGGTPIMVLTSGAGTWAVPQDYGCWSSAAIALHRALDETFKASHQR